MKNDKMNVLQFISPSGMYGAEMWIMALAKNLSKDACNCRLAVTWESDAQNLELYQRYKDLGLPAHKMKMSGKFDPSVIIKLVRFIKKEAIQVIHTHGYKSDILGLIAAKITGIKAVATPHGFENAKDLKLQMYIKAGNQALKFFDVVSPLSDELLADMNRIGVKKDRIRLIQNGVDLDEVYGAMDKPVQNAGILDDGCKKIGYVGQMTSRKNVTDLIRCFDLLYNTHKNIQLILIGDGPMRVELEEMAAGLSSGGRIVFLGYRKDRLELLNKLDVFCMTSSLEGIPRCMMEAMGMGKPVAAFNIIGVDKLIIDGDTGLSVSFGDVKGLAGCLEKLLFDEKYSGDIAQRGKQHVEKHFSAARMADEYLNLYEQLIT